MTSISTLVDRVKIIILSSGTGNFQLGTAVPHYRGVEALIDGAQYSYAVESGAADYEAGVGIYVAATATLTRAPEISSNSGAAVNFPAGVQLSFVALAQDLVATGGVLPIIDAEGSATDKAISQRAATAGINGILTGTSIWTLPDEANGDPIPAPGSKLPYLSAGVLKIA